MNSKLGKKIQRVQEDYAFITEHSKLEEWAKTQNLERINIKDYYILGKPVVKGDEFEIILYSKGIRMPEFSRITGISYWTIRNAVDGSVILAERVGAGVYLDIESCYRFLGEYLDDCPETKDETFKVFYTKVREVMNEAYDILQEEARRIIWNSRIRTEAI